MADGDLTRPPDDLRQGWRLEVRPRNLEDLSKLIAAVAVTCYVLGLLTVNTYLYGLGVSDFALFRARFVLVGVAMLVPILFALVWYVVAGLLIQVSRARLPWQQNAAIIVISVATLGTTVFVILVLNRWLTPDVATLPSRLGVPISFWLVGTGLGIVLTSSAAISLGSSTRAGPGISDESTRPSNPRDDSPFVPLDISRSRNAGTRAPLHNAAAQGGGGTPSWQPSATAIPFVRGPALVLVLVSMFVSFALYLLLFAELAFPLIPEQFGGGKPRPAHLLLSEEGVASAEALGLPVTGESHLTPLVSVLWESEEALVIRPPGQADADTVVRLDRSLVHALIVDLSESPATIDATPAVEPNSSRAERTAARTGTQSPNYQCLRPLSRPFASPESLLTAAGPVRIVRPPAQMMSGSAAVRGDRVPARGEVDAEPGGDAPDSPRHCRRRRSLRPRHRRSD